jgi:membrane-associated phospholipid phosphatase
MKPLSHRNRDWRWPLAILVALAASVGAVRQASADPPSSDAAAIVLPDDTRVTLSEPPAPDAGTAPADDQESAPTGGQTRSFISTLVHNLADDVKHLPRRNTIYWAAGGAALALAVHPADKTVNRHLLGSSAWDHFFIPGKTIGATEVQVAGGLVIYGIGRYRGENEVRHLGMDLIEAQLLSEGLVEAMKAIGRRPRPPNPDGTPNATKTFSFPSGHSAVTFASATVLQQHLGWKWAIPTYLIASYVATSRLHDNQHYLSDVVFGAATGIIVGRAVTWHGRNNYPIAPAVGPDYLGMTIEWK